MPAEPPAVAGERLGAGAVTWLRGGGVGWGRAQPASSGPRLPTDKPGNVSPQIPEGRQEDPPPTPPPGTDKQLAEVSPGVQVQAQGH